ncbi:MAG: trehalase family glycosidase [Bryobacteraceae bacterium]
MFLTLLAAQGTPLLTWADRVDLEDLVPYTHPSAAWSDRHSDVAISWPDPGAPGLQRLESVVGWGGTKITDALLRWAMTEDGTELPLKLSKRSFSPGVVTEKSTTGDLAITTSAAFPERNVIALRFDVANGGPAARTVAISFVYPGKGVAPDWKGPFPDGHFVSLDNEPAGSWSTLYVHHEHGRNVKWVRDFATGMTEGTTLEMVCLADLSTRTLRIPAGSSQSFTFAMSFGRYRGQAREALKAAMRKIEHDWTPAQETARIRELLRKAPDLAPKYRGNPRFERLYAHAITGLNSLFIRGEGGYTGASRLPYTTKDQIAMAFFWDTSFSSIGAREFDPLLGQEAIENFVANAGPRGSLPGTLSDTHRSGEGQAPIMSWAAWKVYQSGHDKAWLARIYPGLAGNVEFWGKYHSSARGLAQFFNAGQIGDNDARFDPVYGREQGNEAVSGFESPDLNSFLVKEMHCLAKMAAELGFEDDAARWNQRAARLAQQIVNVFYFPGEAMFYDVRLNTREKFSGVKNPNMFIPLWAGVPLPEPEVRRVVESHMLNPAEFFRELPFPSLSYDNPKYDPKSYWRGRIWPHFGYWMVQTLWRSGYHREAELTADRLLSLLQKAPWYMENYESTPEGASAAPNIYSRPEYNWTQATAIELLLERYKDEEP